MRSFIFTILAILISSNAYSNCRPQTAIEELKTHNYYDAIIKEKNSAKARSLLNNLHKFRSENYGYIQGEYKTRAHTSTSASSYIRDTSFLGIKVQMHEKVLKPLKCVEEEIKRNCQNSAKAYIPKNISGYRTHKSFPIIISNHRFGIAIDFDPLSDHSHSDGNACCGSGCKTIWRTHPVCKGHSPKHSSPFNVSVLNSCWVNSFQKYGFYWFVDDYMHDSMHFEYLGDPNFWN